MSWHLVWNSIILCSHNITFIVKQFKFTAIVIYNVDNVVFKQIILDKKTKTKTDELSGS